MFWTCSCPSFASINISDARHTVPSKREGRAQGHGGKGNVVHLQYPAPVVEGEDAATTTEYLAEQMLPDGAHNLEVRRTLWETGAAFWERWPLGGGLHKFVRFFCCSLSLKG